MSAVKYSGRVDFGDWKPDVRSWIDMVEELQATFDTNENNWAWLSDDGQTLQFELGCLGYSDNHPTFSVPMEDVFRQHIELQDESEEAAEALRNCAAKLRRFADLADAAADERSKTET